MASFQSQFENVVVGEIKTVTGFTSVDPKPQVLSVDKPDTDLISTPGALVYPVSEKISPATNKQDDIGYGVGVSLVWKLGVPSSDTIRNFRRLILKKFRSKTIITAELVVAHLVEITLGEVSERFDKEQRLHLSEFAFHFFVREEQG